MKKTIKNKLIRICYKKKPIRILLGSYVIVVVLLISLAILRNIHPLVVAEIFGILSAIICVLVDMRYEILKQGRTRVRKNNLLNILLSSEEMWCTIIGVLGMSITPFLTRYLDEIGPIICFTITIILMLALPIKLGNIFKKKIVE